MWYDTPSAEALFMELEEDDSSYRLLYARGYLICRRNRQPVAEYAGPLTKQYLATAIDTLSKAYGSKNVLKPKHIRFEEDGTPRVVEYGVSVTSPCLAVYTGPKNIHQLAADYFYWIDKTKST